MIRIGTPSQTPAATDRSDPARPPRADFPDSRREALRRDDQRGGGLARDHGLLRDGDLGAGHEAASGRSHAFDRRLRDALDAGGDPRRDDRDPPRARVLALVESPPVAPALPLAPLPGAAPAPATLPAPAAPGADEKVMLLVSRIEEAYRQDLLSRDLLSRDLSGRAGQPVTVRVPLDGVAGDLSAITVSVTPTGLDVTLTRGHGGAPSDLVAAAEVLAAHLQARFAKRSVRILEGLEGPGPQPEGDTLSAIGRLLGDLAR